MYHIKFLSSEEQKLLIILMKDVRRNMRKNSPPTLHTTWKTFPVCERGVRRDAMSALWVVHDERSFILLLWLSLREAGKQNPAALWHPRRGKDTGLVSQFHLSERMCVPAQSYPTFCDPIDCSPPGSSVHGILQARILEWVAMPSSRGSSPPRDWNFVSCVSCFAGRYFNNWAFREVQIVSYSGINLRIERGEITEVTQGRIIFRRQ